MSAIGIVGVGVMGLAASRKILQAGHSLYVYDVTPSAQKNALQLGAELKATPAQVADKADIILMFLPGPDQVELCVAGPEGLLSSSCFGTVIVDMSTVDPGVTRRMAELARQNSIGYLDAPILGRPASVGKWALPVGGKKEDLERSRATLEIVAANILYIGESGAGNKIKLLNQMMFGAINAMTAEMMAIAAKMGIAPRLLYETIIASQAGTVSNLFMELGRCISTENYNDPTFNVDLLIKDVHLAVEMARESGAPPLLGRTIEFINEMARAQGQGNMDTAAMWKSFQAIWENR
jgi:3-hydroxyisobutyrate dehydrogenase-like beta-hydroxyacid dehydrogenase